MPSSFVELASSAFPQAQWTGQSHIHVSIANGVDVPMGAANPRKALAAAISLQVVPKIRAFLSSQCEGLEWLLNEEEFDDLLYVDYSRMLTGEGAVSTPNSLKNPQTGNTFHRVALSDEHAIVAGIRVWVTDLSFMSPSDSGMTNYGFRMRLEQQNDESVDLRARSRQVAESIAEQVAEIKEFVPNQDLSALQSVVVNVGGSAHD